MSAAVTERAGTGGLCLFVLRFAVNNGGHRLNGIFAHPFPNAHHVAACGINNLAAAILDLLLNRQFGSKCRHDDNVVGAEISDVRLLISAGEIFDP